MTEPLRRATVRAAAPVGTTELGSARLWAIALCWVAVALDGFDLVVIGAVIPTLSTHGDLGFTDASLPPRRPSAWSASAPS